MKMKVPEKIIPLLVLHRRAQFYWHSSVAEMRTFLEPQMCDTELSVHDYWLWVNAALSWKDLIGEEAYAVLLTEYEEAEEEIA